MFSVLTSRLASLKGRAFDARRGRVWVRAGLVAIPLCSLLIGFQAGAGGLGDAFVLAPAPGAAIGNPNPGGQGSSPVSALGVNGAPIDDCACQEQATTRPLKKRVKPLGDTPVGNCRPMVTPSVADGSPAL